MRKSVNIDSTEWCDLVFKNKNKKYGAYALRQSSGKRHMVAFGVIVILMAFVSVLPQVIGAVKEFTKREDLGAMDQTVELSNILVDQKIPEENIIREEIAPPPPKLKPTIQFVPPAIVEDEKVTDEDKMKTQDEVLDSKKQISIADIGKEDDDKIGIDIAELDKHRVIMEEPKKKDDEIVIHAQQMPGFPGGEAELYRYIADNLKYPVVDQENGTQGRVTLRFVVDKTGKIDKVQIIKGLSVTCDREAIRVVQSMPNWIPGKNNGIPVNVYFTLPIVFKLRN
jgi:protein TonB